MTEFPWYEIIENSNELEQGDILEDWVIKVPKPEDGEVVDESITLVLMTQTCDIQDGISHLLFCPVWHKEDIAKFEPSFDRPATIGNLIRGRVVGFYPINKCLLERLTRPWRIVQFQRIIEIETESVRSSHNINKPRLRLLPPYRESLSQAFARFFMRVGLPIPIDTS